MGSTAESYTLLTIGDGWSPRIGAGYLHGGGRHCDPRQYRPGCRQSRWLVKLFSNPKGDAAGSGGAGARGMVRECLTLVFYFLPRAHGWHEGGCAGVRRKAPEEPQPGKNAGK